MQQHLTNKLILPAGVPSLDCYGLSDSWPLKRIF